MRYWCLWLVVLLAGCGSQMLRGEPDMRPGDPNFAPVPAHAMSPPPAANGAIWQDNNVRSIYGDRSSRRVGDVITVILEEQTSGQKSAQASSSRQTDVELANPNLFGSPVSILGNDLSAGVSGSRSASGRGQANQSNSLSGAITVTIADIHPNGVLRVQGEKWITLNNGSEVIRITGLVRPEDINLNNEVSSKRIADAQLTYSGTGALADASKPGLITRFFNSPAWPF